MQGKRQTKAQLNKELESLRQQMAAFKSATAEQWLQQQAAETSQRYAREIVNTVHEPLVVLSLDLRGDIGEPVLLPDFPGPPEETENCFLYALGNQQWNIPQLRDLLEDVVSQNSHFDDFEVTHDFPTIGRKIMLLNARRIGHDSLRTPMILLAIEDVIERRRAERLLRHWGEWLDVWWSYRQCRVAAVRKDFV